MSSILQKSLMLPSAMVAGEKRQFAIIAFARYYNLLIEYLLLMATAVLMQPSERGIFVMYVSVIAFSSLIASMAYEQYGAAQKHKHVEDFDARNFFSVIVCYTLLIGVGVSFFSIYWLGGSVAVGLLVGLNVVAINLGKQSVVHFQISGEITSYFKRFVVYKTLYLSAVSYAASRACSIEVILLLLLLPNALFLFMIGAFRAERYVPKISIERFFADFSRVKFLYFSSIITALYAFIDLYIIYSNLEPALLSEYNLAMQLNMAIAVIGQAYNVHIYSHGKQDLSSIIFATRKINLFIAGLSILCISAVHLEVFSVIIKVIFGNGYAHLSQVIQSTIWILPASLVAIFYAPIWITSGRFSFLMILSLTGLLLFTISALAMIHLGLEGVIYAQYLVAVYGLVVNIGMYFRTKKSLGISIDNQPA